MRIKHDPLGYIKEHKSWFHYRECGFCKDAVRNETMWQVEINQSSSFANYLYFCKECFPDKNSLNEHLNRTPERPPLRR